MRALLSALIIGVLAIPCARACMPGDAYWAAEIAFNNNESFDLTRLTMLGVEDVNYRVENPDGENASLSDQPVVVYGSQVDGRAMVKVGFSPPGYEWRSVLIVLPQEMDPEAFDFTSAMEQELVWLAQLGAISELDGATISAITRDLVPGIRFFTREMVPSHQGCFSLDYCVRCVGQQAYTRLPPEPLAGGAAVEPGVWGRIKGLFQ